MVEIVRADDNPACLHFCVTARPNSVSGHSGWLIAMAILIPSCTIAGIIFFTIGAWPVSLFMGLPIVGLSAAFYSVERHAGDFERITLDGDRLILDRHTLGWDQHLEFNSYWVQVALHPTAVGGGNMLALVSHGKEVAFGQLMSDEERETLGRELKRWLAKTRH
ncbi:MAG: DUF2244 domain-containing protein [Rhodocyclaceae bacterium]|nr:MAG: DUF2244 domain-containing protein [Rhodocyclaceae bacterium]